MSRSRDGNIRSALVRMIEIGVEPFLVAPSVVGVVAQRLVRRICAHCKEAYSVPADEIQRLFIAEEDAEVTWYRGRGCDECRHTGYHGQIAIHKFVVISEELRRLVAQGAPQSQLLEVAEAKGYKPLYYDGLRKVLLGLTSLEKVFRVAAV